MKAKINIKELNKLGRKVWRVARQNEDPQAFLSDVTEHGCQSGIVTDLIYYVDTVKFFKRYRKEINELLVESLDDTGLSVSELFGDKWDKEDPLAQDTMNQNLLAWFGFEETAYRLMAQLENQD